MSQSLQHTLKLLSFTLLSACMGSSESLSVLEEPVLTESQTNQNGVNSYEELNQFGNDLSDQVQIEDLTSTEELPVSGSLAYEGIIGFETGRAGFESLVGHFSVSAEFESHQIRGQVPRFYDTSGSIFSSSMQILGEVRNDVNAGDDFLIDASITGQISSEGESLFLSTGYFLGDFLMDSTAISGVILGEFVADDGSVYEVQDGAFLAVTQP